MRTLRSHFKRDTLGWRVTWRTYEIWRAFCNPVERVYSRQVLRRVDGVKRQLSRYAVISGGSDCDGMRYAGVEFCRTKVQAEACAEASYAYAEGPHAAHVVSGAEGREWQASYVPDTRDRFAERMGY